AKAPHLRLCRRQNRSAGVQLHAPDVSINSPSPFSNRFFFKESPMFRSSRISICTLAVGICASALICTLAIADDGRGGPPPRQDGGGPGGAGGPGGGGPGGGGFHLIPRF